MNVEDDCDGELDVGSGAAIAHHDRIPTNLRKRTRIIDVFSNTCCTQAYPATFSTFYYFFRSRSLIIAAK